VDPLARPATLNNQVKKEILLTKILITFVFTILYFSSLFGWGCLTEKLFRVKLTSPFTICLGIATWIFLGGILNLLKIAYPISLDLIFLSGLLFSLIIFLKFQKLKLLYEVREQYLSAAYLKRILPSAMIIIFIFSISAYYIAVPSAYNFHDDMEKYFCHPVRMLANGTLFGSKFSALGTETFGAQAFLHGFALSHFSIKSINAVDAVFTFTLFLIVILHTSDKIGLPKWITPLIVLVPVLINPQYVNISSIYTGSVLILFLLLVQLNNINSEDLPSAALFGLVYSALIALKTTFLTFAAIHFFVLIVVLYFMQNPKKKVFLWVFRVIGYTLLFLSPWILLYYPSWNAIALGTNTPSNLFSGKTDNIFLHYLLNLFSSKSLFYGFGNSFLDYTLLIIICGLLSILVFVNQSGNKLNKSSITVSVLISCISIVIFYFICNVFFAPFLLGQNHGLRYTLPVVIAALPASLIMCSAFFKNTLKNSERLASYTKHMALIAFFFAIILFSFLGSSIERYKQAINNGSVLSFQNLAKDPNYIKYNQFALGNNAKNIIRRAQKSIPKGKALIAWTPLQFHLDYHRNTIFDVDPAGLASPWMDIPFKGTTNDIISYFNKKHIKYIIWEYRGPAIRSTKEYTIRMKSLFPRERSIAIKTYLFHQLLSRISKNAQILFNNGSIAVLKIPD